MSIKKKMKIVGVSYIRSDYDLLSELYKRLAGRKDIEFRLLVGGAHFSSQFGNSFREIQRDRIPVLACVKSLIDSDTPASRIKSAAIFMKSAINLFEAYHPDIVIYAGDREDALVTASLCAYMKIPTIHFFGGDHAVDGNVDNPVRHAISKLSTFHFVAHPAHKERLLRIGENKSRIHLIGSPALDKFRLEKKISRREIFRRLGAGTLPANTPYAVMIHHAILSQERESGKEAEAILWSLSKLGIKTFIGNPNTDAGCRDILRAYKKFKNAKNFIFYENASRSVFVNLIRNADFLIGNSSMGLLEAPSVPLPVINVGERQKGRLAAGNVLFVPAQKKALVAAIQKVMSKEFRRKIARMKNPYGDGHSTQRAVQRILKLDHRKWLYKREDPLSKRS
jgi:GDP/UDP-N,N'-diacetylbacillosamine 2-epimerase (hydrolysing)